MYYHLTVIVVITLSQQHTKKKEPITIFLLITLSSLSNEQYKYTHTFIRQWYLITIEYLQGQYVSLLRQNNNHNGSILTYFIVKSIYCFIWEKKNFQTLFFSMWIGWMYIDIHARSLTYGTNNLTSQSEKCQVKIR